MEDAARKLLIIGGGVMGAAFAEAWLRDDLVGADNLMVVEKDPLRRERLGSELSCRVVADYPASEFSAQAALLAVKPQDAEAVCRSLHAKLPSDCVVISIIAGVSLEFLADCFGERLVVRAMPNTPARIGQGATVYVLGRAAAGVEQSLVEVVLGAAGACYRVAEEGLLDAATAVSGCGPAYFFYFFEQMLAEAQSLGLDRSLAQDLIRETALGAVALWQNSGLEPGVLREQVTSKGGCTEAALEVFAQKQLGEILRQGMQRAYRRSQELGTAAGTVA